MAAWLAHGCTMPCCAYHGQGKGVAPTAGSATHLRVRWSGPAAAPAPLGPPRQRSAPEHAACRPRPQRPSPRPLLAPTPEPPAARHPRPRTPAAATGRRARGAPAWGRPLRASHCRWDPQCRGAPAQCQPCPGTRRHVHCTALLFPTHGGAPLRTPARTERQGPGLKLGSAHRRPCAPRIFGPHLDTVQQRAESCAAAITAPQVLVGSLPGMESRAWMRSSQTKQARLTLHPSRTWLSPVQSRSLLREWEAPPDQ